MASRGAIIMAIPTFNSSFTDKMQQFVNYKQTQGYDYTDQAKALLYFDRFACQRGYTQTQLSQKMIDILSSTGALAYAMIGLMCILAGGAYLEYDMLPFGTPKMASHLGIYGVEIGIGITVAAVLITIFFETAGRKDD